MHFVWRIPHRTSARDETLSFRLYTKCLADIPIYHSRVKKSLFLASTVHPSFIHSRAAAKAIWEYITGDRLPTNHSKYSQNAITLSAFALASQDLDIATDLRTLNGRPDSGKFDCFLDTAKAYLESLARVDDRRHGEVPRPFDILPCWSIKLSLRIESDLCMFLSRFCLLSPICNVYARSRRASVGALESGRP